MFLGFKNWWETFSKIIKYEFRDISISEGSLLLKFMCNQILLGKAYHTISSTLVSVWKNNLGNILNNKYHYYK